MALIDPNCAFSFQHYIKNTPEEKIVNGIDEKYLAIMKVLIKLAQDSAFEKGLSKEAIAVVTQSVVIASVTLYHLFRIQKESDDLERNGS